MSGQPFQIDSLTYRLVKASPEAVALRTRATEWSKACDADSLHAPDPGRSVRSAEAAHRRFLDAAVQFAEIVRRRGREHLHLMARNGELIQFFPLTADAKSWIRDHGTDGKCYMVSFWCEELTVRSVRDRRFRRTFGPQEATWGRIESEADRVAYQRRLEKRDPPVARRKRRSP